MIQDDSLPFLYLSNPVYHAIYRHLGCIVFFQEDVPESLHSHLETKLPRPLQYESIWSPRFVFVGTADWLNADVRAAYNPSIADYLAKRGIELGNPQRLDAVMESFDLDPTPDELHAFSQGMHDWFQALHQRAPIGLIYTTDLVELPVYRQQNQRDLTQILTQVLPFLTNIWRSQGILQKTLHRALPGMLELASQSIVKLYLQHNPKPPPEAIQTLQRFAKTVEQCHADYPVRFWTHHLPQQLQNNPSL